MTIYKYKFKLLNVIPLVFLGTMPRNPMEITLLSLFRLTRYSTYKRDSTSHIVYEETKTNIGPHNLPHNLDVKVVVQSLPFTWMFISRVGIHHAIYRDDTKIKFNIWRSSGRDIMCTYYR